MSLPSHPTPDHFIAKFDIDDPKFQDVTIWRKSEKYEIFCKQEYISYFEDFCHNQFSVKIQENTREAENPEGKIFSISQFLENPPSNGNLILTLAKKVITNIDKSISFCNSYIIVDYVFHDILFIPNQTMDQFDKKQEFSNFIEFFESLCFQESNPEKPYFQSILIRTLFVGLKKIPHELYQDPFFLKHIQSLLETNLFTFPNTDYLLLPKSIPLKNENLQFIKNFFSSETNPEIQSIFAYIEEECDIDKTPLSYINSKIKALSDKNENENISLLNDPYFYELLQLNYPPALTLAGYLIIHYPINNLEFQLIWPKSSFHRIWIINDKFLDEPKEPCDFDVLLCGNPLEEKLKNFSQFQFLNFFYRKIQINQNSVTEKRNESIRSNWQQQSNNISSPFKLAYDLSSAINQEKEKEKEIFLFEIVENTDEIQKMSASPGSYFADKWSLKKKGESINQGYIISENFQQKHEMSSSFFARAYLLQDSTAGENLAYLYQYHWKRPHLALKIRQMIAQKKE